MPVTAPEPEVIRDAVMLAGRAPSLHNSQPWRWVVEDTKMHLWADPRRMLHATDHTGRELTLSCGAVLDHLRVAMAAAGWDSATERLPDPSEPDHLATLQFRPAEPVTEAQQQRAAAILRRRTHRLPFPAPAAWPAVESALRRAGLPYAVTLDVVVDEARPTLAEASRRTEAPPPRLAALRLPPRPASPRMEGPLAAAPTPRPAMRPERRRAAGQSGAEGSRPLAVAVPPSPAPRAETEAWPDDPARTDREGVRWRCPTRRRPWRP